MRSRKSFAFNKPVITLIYSALSKELRETDFLVTSRTSVTSLSAELKASLETDDDLVFPTLPV